MNGFELERPETLLSKEDPAISVVVPVYNSGAFLEECVSSLLKQHHSDYELILVDDKSTDPLTLSLLASYKTEDPRISVIHQPQNIGAAAARNVGLTASKGEYIIFLDSDDVFDADMLSCLYRTIEDHDADICICAHQVFSDLTGEKWPVSTPKMKQDVTNRVFSVKELGDDGLDYWAFVPWNKLCRSSFLKRNHIRFQSLPSQNDIYFSVMCSLLAQRIVYADTQEPLIYYRIQTSSQISSAKDWRNFYPAIRRCIDDIWSCASQQEKAQLVYLLMEQLIEAFRHISDIRDREKIYKDIQQFLRHDVRKNPFSAASRRASAHFRCWVELELSTGWQDYVDNYYLQLYHTKDELMDYFMESRDPVIIWGNGARGKALQKLLSTHNIENALIVDLNPAAVEHKNPYGYEMTSAFTAKAGQTIIATNDSIYESIKYLASEGVHVISLQQYCWF